MKQTVGVIFTSFNMADLLPMSLNPWCEARRKRLGGHHWLICAVSVPFKKFNEPRTDSTLPMLRQDLENDVLDHLIESEEPMEETEARGLAMKWLIEQGADLVWQADADEAPTEEEIRKTIDFVEKNPFVTAFQGCLRNFVFDEHTWLAKPFTPMRIHRVKSGTYVADHFWDDNNISYRGTVTRDFKRDTYFATMQIPKAIAWVKHLSWLSDERSKRKTEYQRLRWGSSSFRWNQETNRLEWDESHFAAHKLPFPPELQSD